jgi:hypothetical protein
MSPMLGHDDLRFGHVKDLPGLVLDGRTRCQRLVAAAAGAGIMVDDDVRILGLTQGLSWMTFLPARLFAGGLPQAPNTGRLLQSVTRRRLATVTAVEAQPTLQFRNPLLLLRNPLPQPTIFRQQLLDLFNQFLDIGGRFHPTLESDSPFLHQRPHVGESIGRNILKTPHLPKKPARVPRQ